MGREQQTLIEFLHLAIALCDILDTLIRHHIIHKDIKPANILMNPETKQVKLIDFSIASLLPRETQTLINPNVLEGTLGNISPEQTGRMNRGIDYRTDFYSLGVTFYELLTRKLPFQSADAMELVHSHIAKAAPLVHEIDPKNPSVLSGIVNKLMAKNAEDRYQSALGRRCRRCRDADCTIPHERSFHYCYNLKDKFCHKLNYYCGRKNLNDTRHLDAFQVVLG